MTTTRLSFQRAVLAAALVALVVGALGAVPVRAASSVTIEARALVGGRYEAGGWAALAVTLVNEGSPTEGYLTAETDAGTVRRYVEMPAGARKVVTLYVRPGGFQIQLTVQYEDTNGVAATTAGVRVFDLAADQVAIVGDNAGTIRRQMVGGQNAIRRDPIVLTVADLPERPEPLEGLSVLVWAGDGAALGEGQRRSIERWIAGGGQLVLSGGADWQSRTDGLDHLLPLESLAAVDDVDQQPLAAWAGSDEGLPSGTVSTGALRDGARALATADDGAPLGAWHSLGSGRVVMLGSDLGLESFAAWGGAPLLWSRILDAGSPLDEFFGGKFPDQAAASGAMARALETLPSLELPPVELLLGVIVTYIVLIGPLSYVVLRRIDRRELAWVTAPLLVIVFSATSYGIGIALKGTDVIVNQITVMRSAAGGTHASVESYAGIFSPDRGTYDVIVDADALVAGMSVDQFREDPAMIGTRRTADQGRPAQLNDLPIAVGGFEYVRADTLVSHAAPLQVAWSYRGTDLVGRVTNMSAEPLNDVAFITDGGGKMVGDLAPGATREFVIDRAGVSQSPAADQVYGFAGLNASDPDRRRIAARRGVIESLVSYRGMGLIGSGRSGYGGSGPYLIGWRPGASPAPIVLDGVEARTFSEIVEVVAVRPGLGDGQVAIGPDEMSVSASAAGGAEVVENATVFLGLEPGASATFSISLPLEASDLTVTSLDVLAGNDPLSVVQDGGAFPWPAGHTIEVLDPLTGEWSLLGELGNDNRFTVDEPHGAISAAGRIIVRVTSTQPDPAIGDPGVFVSARVQGEIER